MTKYTPDEFLKAKSMIENYNDFPAPMNNATAVCAELLAENEELKRLLQEHQTYQTKQGIKP